ncbi:MAG TPA: serine hydrolase domain-containing protein, partial [Blastocatellia bacterium]|nr:serine hydrolase domain-containing protein [Blastocatellia bacterium]
MRRIVVLSLFAIISFSLAAGDRRSVAQSPRPGLPTARPEDVGMSSERLARIRAGMQRYVDSGMVPGVVTLVARRGRVVHFEAVGNRDVEAKAPMTTDTIFRIASMTKPIASVALMTLYEEGHFLLNDPISK